MLYKYRPLNERSLAMVLRPELYFASPASLNDPLEVDALLHIDGTKEQVVDHLSGYRRAVIESLQTERTDLARKHGRYVDGDISVFGSYNRRLSRVRTFEERVRRADAMIQQAQRGTTEQALAQLRGFYDQLLEPVRLSGICSLAGEPDNELMWAHYANQHRGICFEFAPCLFNGNRKVIERRVTYSGTGIVDALEHGYLNTFELLFSVKSKAWAYENETRFFIYGDPRPVAVSHGVMESVILGYRVYSTAGLSDERAQRHRAQVEELGKNIRAINKARQKQGKLKIKRVERHVYGFTVRECNTGEELERMRAFLEEAQQSHAAGAD